MNVRRGHLRTVVIGVIRVIDLLASPVLGLALIVVKVFRVLGTCRTPVARRLYDTLGVMPVIDHFYEPLVTPAGDLRPQLRLLGDSRSSAACPVYGHSESAGPVSFWFEVT